jgi:hypothetical protein
LAEGVGVVEWWSGGVMGRSCPQDDSATPSRHHSNTPTLLHSVTLLPTQFAHFCAGIKYGNLPAATIKHGGMVCFLVR